MSVPTKGHPTKNNKAVGATDQWKKKQTSAVSTALKPRNGSDDGMTANHNALARRADGPRLKHGRYLKSGSEMIMTCPWSS